MSAQGKAYARYYEQIGNAALELARELRNLSGESMGVAHMGLPWNERLLRQSLILQEVVDEGGVVTKEEWIEIAGRYGYAGRGLSGFFRSDGSGLLEMKGPRVSITRKGKSRLKENKERVDAWRSSRSE